MYTLRKVIGNDQWNKSIGDEYSFIDRETNYEEFCKAFEKSFTRKHVADLDSESDEFTKNCYAFIVCKGGSEMIPLYKNQYNYIMSESGNTFSNLTLK